MKIYKEILHTPKTEDQVRENAKNENWIGELTQEDIDNMVAYNKAFAGVEVCLDGIAKMLQ